MLSEFGASYTFALGAALVWAQLPAQICRRTACGENTACASEWLSEPLLKSDVEWDGYNPVFTDHG